VVDLPTRNCIVCRRTFKPSRSDQRYCSSSGNYTCENNLRNAERDNDDLFVMALVRQEYGCVGCGAKKGENCKSSGLVVTGKLRPLVLNPAKVGDGEPLLPEDMAVSCRAERDRLYLGMATGESDD